MSNEKKINPILAEGQNTNTPDQNERITRRQALKRMAKGAVYVMGVIGIMAGASSCEPPYDDYYDYYNYYGDYYYYNYYDNKTNYYLG